MQYAVKAFIKSYNLRNAFVVKPGRHVEVGERDRDFGGDFRAECKLVTKPLQVDAKRVRQNSDAGKFEAVAKFLTCCVKKN